MRRNIQIQKVPALAPEVTAVPVPVPTGGWDAISPLASMKPENAVILDNWIPRPGWVELRPGYEPWSITGTNSPVETLMIYRSPTGEKMFAASGGNIYDVTTTTAVSVVSGKSNNRWQYINFTPQGSATHYLFAVNGVDAPLQYDGTSWTNPAYSGFTASNAINIQVYQRRIWFTLRNTCQFVYLGTDSISGAGTVFDVGALWDLGGHAVAMGNWTVDGGVGPNNYAAFVSSRGQVTMYLGIDPNNANTWNLVGTFKLSPPLGTRCLQTVGSDLAMISLQGVVPLSQALPFDPSAVRSVALTSKIQNAMAAAAVVGQNLFGWQLITYPSQTLAVLNVPVVENQSQNQFVMNALTGAWCRFTGWNANCFELYNDQLYFGDNVGAINAAFMGAADGSSAIVADMKCAFNYFGNPGLLKRITMIQPIMVADGQIIPTMSVDVDFSNTSPSAPASSFTAVGALWDVAKWDQSQWVLNSVTLTNWLAAEGIGHAMAVRMKVNFLPTGIGGFDTGLFDGFVFDADQNAPTLQVNLFTVLLETGAVV